MIFLVLVALGALTLVLLPVWGVLDALRQPDERWRRLDTERGRWIALQVALGPLGTGAYLYAIRPHLVSEDRRGGRVRD